jgi:hypothetical protein
VLLVFNLTLRQHSAPPELPLSAHAVAWSGAQGRAEHYNPAILIQARERQRFVADLLAMRE